MFEPRMADEGTANSLIAVDRGSGRLLGGFLCEDFCSADPPGFDAFLGQADGNWAPVLSMIEELETKRTSDDKAALEAARDRT